MDALRLMQFHAVRDHIFHNNATFLFLVRECSAFAYVSFRVDIGDVMVHYADFLNSLELHCLHGCTHTCVSFRAATVLTCSRFAVLHSVHGEVTSWKSRNSKCRMVWNERTIAIAYSTVCMYLFGYDHFFFRFAIST